MTDKIPVAVWSGSFMLFGIDVKCHTLSNGQRIIEADSMHQLLAALNDGPGEIIDVDMEAFAKWQRGAN